MPEFFGDKMMVKIYYQDRFIGSSEYCIIEHSSYENTSKMTFFGYVGQDIEVFPSDELIRVKITYKNIKSEICDLFELDLYCLDLVHFVNGNVTIYCKVFDRYVGIIYNQYMVEFFKNWENGIEIDHENTTWEKKDALLRCLGKYSGISEKIRSDKSLFVIDGNEMFDWYDFYLILSRELIGEKGFFAFGLDSLEDSLISIFRSNGPKNIVIEFKNARRIKTILGEDYYKKAIAIFGGFNILIEEN